jgi:hypothetical protein
MSSKIPPTPTTPPQNSSFLDESSHNVDDSGSSSKSSDLSDSLSRSSDAKGRSRHKRQGALTEPMLLQMPESPTSPRASSNEPPPLLNPSLTPSEVKGLSHSVLASLNLGNRQFGVEAQQKLQGNEGEIISCLRDFVSVKDGIALDITAKLSKAYRTELQKRLEKIDVGNLTKNMQGTDLETSAHEIAGLAHQLGEITRLSYTEKNRTLPFIGQTATELAKKKQTELLKLSFELFNRLADHSSPDDKKAVTEMQESIIKNAKAIGISVDVPDARAMAAAQLSAGVVNMKSLADKSFPSRASLEIDEKRIPELTDDKIYQDLYLTGMQALGFGEAIDLLPKLDSKVMELSFISAEDQKNAKVSEDPKEGVIRLLSQQHPPEDSLFSKKRKTIDEAQKKVDELTARKEELGKKSNDVIRGSIAIGPGDENIVKRKEEIAKQLADIRAELQAAEGQLKEVVGSFEAIITTVVATLPVTRFKELVGERNADAIAYQEVSKLSKPINSKDAIQRALAKATQIKRDGFVKRQRENARSNFEKTKTTSRFSPVRIIKAISDLSNSKADAKLPKKDVAADLQNCAFIPSALRDSLQKKL